jgi:hypothetical protein
MAAGWGVARRRGEAEHAADGGESAARREGVCQRVGRLRLGEEEFELAGVDGGLGAEGGDQPASAGGERGLGMRAAGVGPRGTRARRKAGGEAGEGAGEAARGAGEVRPERDDQRGAEGVAQEAAGDKGGEAEEDAAEPAGEVGSEGKDGAGLHGKDS